MRSVKSTPYIRPIERCFLMTDWKLPNGSTLQDMQLLDQWDANMPFTCMRIININLSLLISTGALTEGVELGLLASWWSEGTGLRGVGGPTNFTLNNNKTDQDFCISIEIPSAEVSRSIKLRTTLVLKRPTAVMLANPLAPKRPGSVIWDHSISIILEGSTPRFPISVVDFIESGLGTPKACWRFEWTPADPQLPAMASMRLLINSRSRIFYRAVVSVSPTGPELAIRSALKHAVAVEMIQLAILHAKELDLNGELEEGSAGKVLVELVERVFNGVSPIECAELYARNPSQFSAELQSKLSLFSESELVTFEP